MSTLAIPPRQVQLYRALWGRWIIVLRILLDLGAGAHPVKWQDVANTLLVDKKTSQKYINGLVRDGHITAAGGGYMLTQAGMDILLENGRGEFLPDSGENFSLLKESVVVVNQELKPLTTTTTTKLGKNPGEIFSPEVLTALENVPLLFDGAEVSQTGLSTYLHIEKVLGWIAYVYDKRMNIERPCGLIYSKLIDPHSPSPYIKYMKNPEHFLPDDYLDAIGRYHQTCQWCHREFTSLQEYQEHYEECLHNRDNFPDGGEEETPFDMADMADETITSDILDLWDGVLKTLSREMPRAPFQTWVQDATPVHVDGSGWIVAARNAYARDWLASRMTTIAEKCLGGRVTFVAAGVSAEKESSDAE